MYFGSTKNEWAIIIFLLVIVMTIIVFLWKKYKNFVLSLTFFSILSNLVFYIDSGSLYYDVHNLKWFVIFTLDYWPWINLILLIILIISIIKNRGLKKNA